MDTIVEIILDVLDFIADIFGISFFLDLFSRHASETKVKVKKRKAKKKKKEAELELLEELSLEIQPLKEPEQKKYLNSFEDYWNEFMMFSENEKIEEVLLRDALLRILHFTQCVSVIQSGDIVNEQVQRMVSQRAISLAVDVDQCSSLMDLIIDSFGLYSPEFGNLLERINILLEYQLKRQ